MASRSVTLRGPTAPAESPLGDSRGRELRWKLGPESVPRTPHAALTMAPARLLSLHGERGSSQPKGRSHQLHAFTGEQRGLCWQGQTVQTRAPQETRQWRPQSRPEKCRKRESRAGGKGRAGSGQMEDTTSDWLVGGKVASLRGSKVGLVSVSPFAPETRVFGNSLRKGCWYARAGGNTV